MFSWKSRALLSSASLLAVISLSACGAPDYGAMKPNVWKPSALVVLVDHPAHWQTSDVTQLANSVGRLVLKCVDTSSSQLPAVLSQAVQTNGLGLVAVVYPGAVPTDAITFAKSHAGIRFELIGTSPAQGSMYNVRQVTTNQLAVSYVTGWLAGQMAIQSNQQVVGFIPPTAPGPASQVQTMLAGLYDADPTVNLLPLTPSGLPPLQIPAIDLSSGQPSPSDQQALQSRRAFFLSVGGSGQPVAPALPGPSHLSDDFVSFTQGKWQSGAAQTVDPPLVLANPTLIPATVQTALTGEVSALAADASLYQNAWSGLPANVRAQWGSIAGV